MFWKCRRFIAKNLSVWRTRCACHSGGGGVSSVDGLGAPALKKLKFSPACARPLTGGPSAPAI